MFYQYIKYIFSQKPIHIYQLISYFSSFLYFLFKEILVFHIFTYNAHHYSITCSFDETNIQHIREFLCF